MRLMFPSGGPMAGPLGWRCSCTGRSVWPSPASASPRRPSASAQGVAHRCFPHGFSATIQVPKEASGFNVFCLLPLQSESYIFPLSRLFTNFFALRSKKISDYLAQSPVPWARSANRGECAQACRLPYQLGWRVPYLFVIFCFQTAG